MWSSRASRHYITPSWYETKRETGKVVPTWNYAIVQVYGPLIVRDDPEWLRIQVGELTSRHEENRARPLGCRRRAGGFHRISAQRHRGHRNPDQPN